MINTHDLEVLVKNIVKIRQKTLKFSFTTLNIKDEVKS